MVASHATPTGDQAGNPGMFSDWESNPWPFDSQAGIRSTPARGLFIVLICLSLITNDVEHPFMYFLAICVSSLGNVKSNPLLIKKKTIAPAWWLSWLERCPKHQKFTGSITSQGTYLGYSFNPLLGHVRKASNQCFSLALIFRSLSLLLLLSFPSSLSKIIHTHTHTHTPSGED